VRPTCCNKAHDYPNWNSAGKFRQRVLELICEGLSTRAIAQKIGISRHTVQLDVQFLLATHGADNMVQLGFMAGHRGLVK
jgi:DNA-binding NarL/FixJ family response regulator